MTPTELESKRMIENPDMARDVAVESAKASIAVTGFALTLNEWVAVATLVYISLQAAYLVWKWHRDWKAKREP